ncbi:hypothetical protein ACGGAI_23815 [Streptomyces antibioticus]
MTGVIAYALLVTTVAAIVCCHHGEHGRTTSRALLRAIRRAR